MMSLSRAVKADKPKKSILQTHNRKACTVRYIAVIHDLYPGKPNGSTYTVYYLYVYYNIYAMESEFGPRGTWTRIEVPTVDCGHRTIRVRATDCRHGAGRRTYSGENDDFA